MKDFDLSLIFKERRFMGVRFAVYTFPFALLGFLFFAMGYTALGLSVFFLSWIGAAVGFFIHLSRWRDPK